MGAWCLWRLTPPPQTPGVKSFLSNFFSKKLLLLFLFFATGSGNPPFDGDARFSIIPMYST